MSPQEQASELAKVTPPITITGLTILGFPVSDVVLLLTAIYTLLQIALLVRRMIRDHAASNMPCGGPPDCPQRRLEK